jgi:hypothetical protein
MIRRSLTSRTRIVRNVKDETGAIFSIGEKDLTSCDHQGADDDRTIAYIIGK